MSCDFPQLATRGVRGLRPYEPGKPIEELERELGSSGIVKLASNENPLGAGRKARAALGRCLGDVSRYPDGNGHRLKAALGERLRVPREALTLGNGSNDVLELIVRAFVTPEHEVVYSQHAFAVYALATQAVGARAVVVPARAWWHDLEAMAKAVSERTRVVFVANPNNPTGTWVGEGALREFAARLPDDVLLVVDEAYAEYVVDEDYPDCTAWIEALPNVIVTRTFSKVHGLAGLRVGYCVSDPAIAEVLNRVRQPFNVNAPALVAASAALDDEAHIRESVALNAAGLEKLCAAFARMGLETIPSAGNFVSVDVGGSADVVYRGLLGEGVIVRPIASYGLANHLRVTVGLDEENERFLCALERVLSRLAP